MLLEFGWNKLFIKEENNPSSLMQAFVKKNIPRSALHILGSLKWVTSNVTL